MASLIVAGDTSGTVTLQAPAIAGSTVLTLPTTSGTIVTTGGGASVPFAAGSAASPSITFTGDTNTGIFSPGADTIAFSEGGVESMRIDSSGQVMVGTTASATSTPFTVQSTSLAGFGVDVINNTSNLSRLRFCQNGTTSSWTSIQADGRSTGYLGLFTNDTERMRIDSSGKVGIGTTSPSSYDSSSLMAVASNSNTSITVASGSTGLGQILFANGTSVPNIYNGLIRYDHNGNAMSFFTNGGNQRMIIDSSGNLLVGTTTNLNGGRVDVSGAGRIAGFTTNSSSGSQDAINVANQASATYNAIRFWTGGTVDVGTLVGRINCTTSATSYITSSDYRLKENIAPMTGALAKVNQLKPCTYTWKVDGSSGQGFIAHELQEVVPDCVSGEKDAVNEDGSIDPQGIDTSFLVATLTAAIQEQQAIITAMEARLTALENK